MATDIARVQIVGEDKTGPAVASARRNLDSLGGSAKKAQGDVTGLGDRVNKLGGSLASLKNASFLGGLLGAGVFVSAVREATEAERAINQLNSTLRSTGGVVGLTGGQLSQFADELAAVSNFDDDDLIKGMTTLTRFRSVSGDAFKEASRLAIDLAAATGGDLVSAFDKMGRVTADPIGGLRGLKEAGVVLNDSQEKLIQTLVKTGDTAKAQQVIFAELAKAVGGSAGTDTQGLGGAFARLSKAWNNLLEDFGNSSILKGAANGLAEILEFTERLDTRLGNLLSKTGGDPTQDKNYLVDLVEQQKAADRARMEALQSRLKKSQADLEEIAQIQKRLEQIQSASNKAFISGIQPILDAGEAYKKYQDAVSGTGRNTQDSALQKQSRELSVLLDQYIKLEVAAAKASGMSQTQAEALGVSIGNREAPAIKQASDRIISGEGRKEAQQALEQLRQQLHAAQGEGDAFYASISKIIAKLPEMEGKQFMNQANELRERVQVIEAEKQAQEELKQQEEERAQQRESLIQSFRAEAEAMQREIALGKDASVVERLRYEIVSGRFRELNEVQKDELARLGELIEKNEEIIRQEKEKADLAEKKRREEEAYDNRLKSMRSNTPSGRSEAEASDVEFAKDALARGKISVKQYEEILNAIEKARDGTKDSFREIESFLRSWSAKSTDAIVDFTFGAEVSVRDMVDSMLKDLARLAIQKTITKPLFDAASGALDGLFGGSGGGDAGDWLGDALKGVGSVIFGGGMASGGAVQAGRMYRVGEMGPEMFVPRTAGSIVPNGGGGAITTNISVSVNNSGQTSSSSSGQEGNRLARVLEQGVRDVLLKEMRNGGMLAK